MKPLWVFTGMHMVGIVVMILLITGVARPQTVTPLTGPAPQPPQEPPYIAPPVSLAPPIASHCEAASLAYLVGKPRTEIPVPVDPTSRRVSCTTCPVTQDYQPGRTDILFDAASGLITEVKCG
ncbi:MAG TPA: hypothetical protein VE309_06070 [Caulobacteraceae bacterium]|jgi:hypothetical protein|nr:hypothetical protein [Caulobacteraceae bacterium]